MCSKTRSRSKNKVLREFSPILGCVILPLWLLEAHLTNQIPDSFRLRNQKHHLIFSFPNNNFNKNRISENVVMFFWNKENLTEFINIYIHDESLQDVTEQVLKIQDLKSPSFSSHLKSR